MSFQSPHDDEALARLLQFQEQQSDGPTTPSHYNTENVVSPRPTTMTDQEKSDMELARRMAQMEFMSGSSGVNSQNTGIGAPEQAGSRIDVAASTGAPQGGGAQLKPPPTQPRPRSVFPGPEPANGTPTSTSGQSSDRMARARQLQQQALLDIHQQNQKPQLHTADPPSADNDYELAQRIQREEMGHSTDAEATDDERLARLMAATGRSLRNLSEGELNDMILSATNTETPRRFQRPTSPMQQRAPARRNSKSTPTSPARPSSVLSAHAFSAPTSPYRDLDEGLLLDPEVIGRSDAQDPRPEQAPPLKKPPPQTFNGKKGNPLRNIRRLRGQPQQQGSTPPAGLKPPPNAASRSEASAASDAGGEARTISAIPNPIPPPPRPPTVSGKQSVCVKCGLSQGTFLKAMDCFYHPECFRCAACMEKIDANSPFGFRKITNPSNGRLEQQPFHADCLPKNPQDTCIVCKQIMPRDSDGLVCYVKHPFFDTERMCPAHSNPGNSACVRRCTGCHRFEPMDEPFADLGDGGRCACFACCRSVVMDSSDVIPLWEMVISFFEHKMKLPIWDGMREIPVLVVGYDALNEQISRGGGSHGGSSQIMSRGLCLTDHEHCQRLKMPSMRFNWSNSSFEARDDDSQGFKYFNLPDDGAENKTRAKVHAIMCLSGLPRDLTASILAHEATHAWLKLHPDCDLYNNPLPPQVEEGLAQLVSMLFLNEGLDPPAELTAGDVPPSDDRLRQYFRFCIESDENEIYGLGYHQAAKAYAEVGIQNLMRHIVLCGSFP